MNHIIPKQLNKDIEFYIAGKITCQLDKYGSYQQKHSALELL